MCETLCHCSTAYYYVATLIPLIRPADSTTIYMSLDKHGSIEFDGVLGINTTNDYTPVPLFTISHVLISNLDVLFPIATVLLVSSN
jgi:hypothetical protein